MKSRWVLNIIGGFLLINPSCQKEDELPDVEVYGHAGISLFPERSVYPPNSREAVLYALDVLDADGVEVDVQLTKDSVLVLYHDAYLDQSTNLSGCVPEFNYDELKSARIYGSKHPLARLDEVMELCMSRKKKLFLDMKPYNYCAAAETDLPRLNRALNKILEPYTPLQRSWVTVNTRSLSLLEVISDTLISRSFETENTDLAMATFQAGWCDELCMNYTAMSAGVAEQLAGLQIPYSLFGVKTTGEIRGAVDFRPGKIITDNISFTRKITK